MVRNVPFQQSLLLCTKSVPLKYSKVKHFSSAHLSSPSLCLIKLDAINLEFDAIMYYQRDFYEMTRYLSRFTSTCKYNNQTDGQHYRHIIV